METNRTHPSTGTGPEDDAVLDVVIVGAGAAGVGVGAALSELGLDIHLLEREAVGASFRAWPDEMRFITPSFPANGFDLPDLNAIVPATSPGVALDCQQPSGEEYAEYLRAVVDHYGLAVATGVEVTDIEPRSADVPEPDGVAVDGGDTGRFRLETSDGTVRSRFLVWAGGRFNTPRTDVFAGSGLCVHSAEVDSWADHAAASSADEFLIVGGVESGIDAAVNLLEGGSSVTVLDRSHPWAFRHPDPSETLAPHTLQRLDRFRGSGRLTLIGGADVQRATQTDDGRFKIHARPIKSALLRTIYSSSKATSSSA